MIITIIIIIVSITITIIIIIVVSSIAINIRFVSITIFMSVIIFFSHHYNMTRRSMITTGNRIKVIQWRKVFILTLFHAHKYTCF